MKKIVNLILVLVFLAVISVVVGIGIHLATAPFYWAPDPATGHVIAMYGKYSNGHPHYITQFEEDYNWWKFALIPFVVVWIQLGDRFNRKLVKPEADLRDSALPPR